MSKVELSPRNDDSEVEIKFNNAKGKFSKRFDIIWEKIVTLQLNRK